MRFHSQTAGVSLTAQQPLNNVVRTALEALSAVLGGTQSLHTNSFDEALALPTEEAVAAGAAHAAVIAHETGVTNTIDPLGGSWFVESLTDQHGAGRLRATSSGSRSSAGWSRRSSRTSPSARSPRPRGATRPEVEDNRRLIVGVNAYEQADEQPLEILRIDPDLERKQIGRLQATRARRDSAEVERSLAALDRGGRGPRPQPDAPADRLRSCAMQRG